MYNVLLSGNLEKLVRVHIKQMKSQYEYDQQPSSRIPFDILMDDFGLSLQQEQLIQENQQLVQEQIQQQPGELANISTKT